MLNQGFTFLIKGGPVMWPLFLCAIISVTVIIERLLAQSAVSTASQGLVSKVRQALLKGELNETERMLEANSSPVAKVLLTGIKNRDLQRDQLEHLMEEVAIDEIPPLSRGLGVLDTIITIAPLLGLLGTVTGMIKAFQIVAVTSGTGAPTGQDYRRGCWRSSNCHGYWVGYCDSYPGRLQPSFRRRQEK